MRPLWQSRNIALVLGGQVISHFGDWVIYITVPLLVLEKTGSPLATALSMVVGAAPGLLIGPLAGAVVDRMDRRRLMITADLLRALLVLLMVWAQSVPVLFALVFAVGVVSQFFLPALQASLPNLVPREQLMAANALRQGLNTTAMVAGPPLGGLIAGLAGTRPAFAIDAASFVLSALLLALARFPSPPPAAARTGAWAEMTAGLAYARRNGAVLGSILLTLVAVGGGAVINAVEPLLAAGMPGGSSFNFGLLVAAWGIGMFAGSLVAAAVSRRWGRRRAFLAALASQAAAPALLAIFPQLGPMLVILALGGVGNAVENILFYTLLQDLVPDQVRGRVFTLAIVTIQTVDMLAIAGWGALAQGVSLRLLLAAAAALIAASCALGWQRWSLSSNERSGIPDPEQA